MDRIINQQDASQPSIEPPSSPPPFLAPPILRRKRTRVPEHTDHSTPSSDGPIFSSDPPDPSVDEYFQPRRKRQYRGTWWGETTRQDVPTEPPQQRAKNGFSRNMDSGIWMGSDVTDEGHRSDDTAPDLELPQEDVGRHAVPRNATQPSSPRIPRGFFNSGKSISRLNLVGQCQFIIDIDKLLAILFRNVTRNLSSSVPSQGIFVAIYVRLLKKGK